MYPTVVVILVHTCCSLVDSRDDTALSTVNFGFDRSVNTGQGELMIASVLQETDSLSKEGKMQIHMRDAHDEEKGSVGSSTAGRDDNIPRFADPLDEY